MMSRVVASSTKAGSKRVRLYYLDWLRVFAMTSVFLFHSDKFFPPHLTKILLEELSLYPEGSWVMLSTREIGRVDKVNKGLILRPKVIIFIDGKGKRLKKKKEIDLAVQKFLYILRPMQHDEIKGLIEDHQS